MLFTESYDNFHNCGRICTFSEYDSNTFKLKYTHEKKKRCIAKISITHEVRSGWAWTFINIASLMLIFFKLSNFYAFSRASHVSSLLFKKINFYVIWSRNTTCNKINNVSYSAYDAKTTQLLKILHTNDIFPSWKSASAEKCKIQPSNGPCWRYLMFFDNLT